MHVQVCAHARVAHVRGSQPLLMRIQPLCCSNAGADAVMQALTLMQSPVAVSVQKHAARGAPSSSFLGNCAAQINIAGDPTDDATVDRFRDRVDLALQNPTDAGGLPSRGVSCHAACHFSDC